MDDFVIKIWIWIMVRGLLVWFGLVRFSSIGAGHFACVSLPGWIVFYTADIPILFADWKTTVTASIFFYQAPFHCDIDLNGKPKVRSSIS